MFAGRRLPFRSNVAENEIVFQAFSSICDVMQRNGFWCFFTRRERHARHARHARYAQELPTVRLVWRVMRGSGGRRSKKMRWLRNGAVYRAARPEASVWLNIHYHVRSHRGAVCSPVRIGTELPDTMKRTARAMAAYRFRSTRQRRKGDTKRGAHIHTYTYVKCM